jgi:small conductance mechanosensitive channel
MEEFVKQIVPKLQEWVTLYGIKVIAALAILILGRWIAKGIRNLFKKILTKRKIDATVVTFIGNLVYMLLITFVILAALAQLNIQTTSFIAVIGAAGLAIGLALQGSLANFAAGFLMIMFRPFKAGDYIEGGGTAGIVEAISVFTTQLITPDNKLIIIPNAKLMGDNIINYSAKETRRVDMVFGVGYDDDLQKVKQVLQDIIEKDSRIMKDPAPLIVVSELADSTVNFAVRIWVKTADYWNVFFGTTETVKNRFDAEGIGIPFPQHDVHLYQQK